MPSLPNLTLPSRRYAFGAVVLAVAARQILIELPLRSKKA